MCKRCPPLRPTGVLEKVLRATVVLKGGKRALMCGTTIWKRIACSLFVVLVLTNFAVTCDLLCAMQACIKGFQVYAMKAFTSFPDTFTVITPDQR